MLAHEFPPEEAPTNPIGPSPVALVTSVAPRRTHLMLVGKPRLSERGRNWLGRLPGVEFDGVELQRMLTLERLSLG